MSFFGGSIHHQVQANIDCYWLMKCLIFAERLLCEKQHVFNCIDPCGAATGDEKVRTGDKFL